MAERINTSAGFNYTPSTPLGGLDAFGIYRQLNGQLAFGGQVIDANTPMPGGPTPEPVSPPVEWADIIGLEDAKRSLQDAIEQPFLNRNIYKFFNMKTPKGVLLYGPPGCGKTMLGKAAAAAMARVHKKPYRDGFMYLNGGEMLGPGWASEKDWIEKGFNFADEFYKKNKYPAVLFFDEADACLPRRETANFFHKNAVNIFLSKMDGMDKSNAFIILATNDHGALDEAATRAGRIDRKIFVGAPGKAASEAMLTLYLLKKPFMKGEKVASAVEEAVFEMFETPRMVGKAPFYKKLNGAMIAQIAENAAGLAFRRAVEALRTEGSPGEMGLMVKDVLSAVEMVHEEAQTMKATAKKDKNPWRWASNTRPEKEEDEEMEAVNNG